MATARWLALAILPLAVAFGRPATAAEGGCAPAIEEFDRISKVVTASPEVESAAAGLAEDARAHCAAGREDDAREQIAAAWEALLGDSELMAVSTEALKGDPCTDTLRQVAELIPAAEVSDYVRDAADELVEDASGLCEEGQPQAAQSKLEMAWSMLQEAP